MGEKWSLSRLAWMGEGVARREANARAQIQAERQGVAKFLRHNDKLRQQSETWNLEESFEALSVCNTLENNVCDLEPYAGEVEISTSDVYRLPPDVRIRESENEKLRKDLREEKAARELLEHSRKLEGKAQLACKRKVRELEETITSLKKKLITREGEWTDKWDKMQSIISEQHGKLKQRENDLQKKHEQIISHLKQQHTSILDGKNEEIKVLREKLICSESESADMRYNLRSHEQTADNYKILEESFAALSVKCNKLENENERILREMKALEGEVKRSKSDVYRLSRDVRIRESENEELRKDLWEKKAACELLEHSRKLEEKAQLDCKRKTEDIRNDLSMAMDNLNMIIRKQADQIQGMREEHSKEMETLRSQNSEVIACITSSHEAALKEKDEAFLKCARRIVGIEEKCTQEVKTMMAAMKQEAEMIQEFYEKFMRTNEKHCSDTMKHMYENFKNVTDKQAEQLLRARNNERILKKLLKEIAENVNPANDDSEDYSGVEIEEIFD